MRDPNPDEQADIEIQNTPELPTLFPSEEKQKHRLKGWFRKPKFTKQLTFTKKFYPALAFIGGFSWDVFTLGRKVYASDLFILLAYYLGAGLCLYLIGREAKFKGAQYINLALQFFMGGLFSALVIFYFISSSFLGSYLLVFLLVALLVGNEFMEKRYARLTVSWMFFNMSGSMYLNFALPHMLHNVHSIWFYLSSALSFAFVFLLSRLSRLGAKLWPSALISGLLILLFQLNWIPPVPFAKRSMAICREYTQNELGTFCKIEPSFWKVWKSSESVLHHRPNEAIYCFTSIFLPSGINSPVAHVWELWDEDKRVWLSTFRKEVPLTGGREKGFRIYTYKRNLPAGKWRVSTENENSQIIGRIKFRVVEVEADYALKLRNIVLD